MSIDPPSVAVGNGPEFAFVRTVLNDLAGKTLALIAATVYLVGLIMVNTYLYSIGVSDFAVLRVRFVMTGFISLMPLVLVIACVLSIAGVYESCHNIVRNWKNHRTHAVYFATSSISVLSFSLVLAYIFFRWILTHGFEWRSRISNARSGSDNDYSFLIYIFGAISITAVLMSGLHGNRYKLSLTNIQRGWIWLTNIVGLATIFIVYVDVFASTFYPLIPEQFGGGQPKNVTIVLSLESGALGTILGFSQAPNAAGYRQVDLLWETDQVYVIREPGSADNRIIQIDRDHVDAVILGRPSGTPEISPEAAP